MRKFHIALVGTTLLVTGCSKVPSVEANAREADTICQQIYQKHFTENGQPMLKVESKTDGGGVCHALVDVEETRVAPQKEMLTYEVNFTYEEFGDRFTWEGQRPTVVARGPMPTLDSEEALIAYADYALKPRNNCGTSVKAIVEGKEPLWDAQSKPNGCATISYRIWNKLVELDQANVPAQVPSAKFCLDYVNALPADPSGRQKRIVVDTTADGTCAYATYSTPDMITGDITIGYDTFKYQQVRAGGLRIWDTGGRSHYFELAEVGDGSLKEHSQSTVADLNSSAGVMELFQAALPASLEYVKKKAAADAEYAANTPSLFGY